MRKFVIGISLLCLFLSVQAKDTADESDILARRGNGVVTQTEFSARAAKIPAEHRLATLRDGNRVRDLINSLLLRSQMASDARDSGFDKDNMVMARMQLAAEAELAEAWIQHYVDIQPAADYEALAKEYYLLNKDQILSSPKIDVSHILISTKERTDVEAEALADTIKQQLTENPELFDEMVLTYSEDPSAKSNNGSFTNVKKGGMVKAFDEAAFALDEGEISEPVRTVYGYHIIRLDAHMAAETLSFEDVKTQLMDQERKKHDERIRGDYQSSLTSLDVKMTEEALQKMVDGYFNADSQNGK